MDQTKRVSVAGMRSRVRAVLAAGGLAAAVGAGWGLAPVALADATPPATPAPIQGGQIHGTVAKVNSDNFVVDTERHGAVTVKFGPAVQHGHAGDHGQAGSHGKARSHQASSLSDLKVGERVVVQGRYNATSKVFTARRVHVLAASKVSHAVGTVDSFTASTGVLVVKVADGSTQTFKVTAETELRPAGKTLASLTPGTKVTVVGKDGVARGIVFQS